MTPTPTPEPPEEPSHPPTIPDPERRPPFAYTIHPANPDRRWVTADGWDGPHAA